MDSIGCKISALRKQKGLSQEELAEQIYVSRQTISNWEKEITSLSTENLEIICKFFGVGADYFITPNTETAVSAYTARAHNSKPLKITAIISGALFAAAMLFMIVITGVLISNSGGHTESVKSVTLSLSYEFYICLIFTLLFLVTFIISFTLYIVKRKKY